MSSKATVEIIATLLKEAEKQGIFDRLRTAFRSKPRILLLGSTGTGKTNLLESLSNPHPAAIHREDRTLYTEAKNLIVNSKAYRFIDTTGDETRGDDRNKAMREAMAAKGGIAGILNVVCYGYHEYDVPRAKVFSPDGAVRPEFLAMHRQVEIRQLDEWNLLLGDQVTSHWLITVVTKADLWYDRHDEVIEHYSKGTYFDALDAARVLRPRVLPYSSVFRKFYGEAPMAGTFDQENHKAAREKLIDALIKALLTKQGE
jgi:energy-coupling factor transporter ATP-binding protein EcfA2